MDENTSPNEIIKLLGEISKVERKIVERALSIEKRCEDLEFSPLIGEIYFLAGLTKRLCEMFDMKCEELNLDNLE